MASAQKKMLAFGYLILAATLQIGATAETYTVGDQLGWTVPPLGEVAYKTWASSKHFLVGDTLVFQWNGTHTVAQVSKNVYDDCSTTNTIGPIHTTSPYSVVINSTDPYYFICTVGSHCRAGQKVTIQAGASASSLTKSAFSAVFLAFAIYFFSLI